MDRDGHIARSLTLIELIKPREPLYDNRKSYSRLDVVKSWREVSMEMNRIYKANYHMEHWKHKWRTLRNIFRVAMKTKSMRQSAILNAMEFMRPILTETMSASHGRKQNSLAAEPVEVLVATSTKPTPTDQQPLNAFDTQDDESILVEDSDSEHGDNYEAVDENGMVEVVPAFEAVDENGMVEVVPASYEFYFEVVEEGVAGNVDINNQQSNAHKNNSPHLPKDDDADEAFLSLIAGELRKMNPSRRQQFKRNVTQLLYS